MEVMREDKLMDKKALSPYLSNLQMYGFGFLVGLVLLLLGSVFFMLPLVFIGDMEISNPEEMMDKMYTYQAFAACACEILGISLSLIFFRKVFIDDFKALKEDWLKYAIIIIIASVLIFASGYVFEWVYDALNLNPDSENQEAIVESLFGKGKVMMIIQVAIVAPIFEEIVFRKLTYGFLRETKLHGVLNFILVAFLFAIIHCTSENFFSYEAYIYLLNYFVLSALLTGSYVLCKDNIYASILVHMINNILSLLTVYGVINAIQLF